MSSAHPSGKPNSRHTTRHPRWRSLDRRRHRPNCSTSRGDSRRHRSAHVPREVDSARIKKIRDHRARDRRNRGAKAPSRPTARSIGRSPPLVGSISFPAAPLGLRGSQTVVRWLHDLPCPRSTGGLAVPASANTSRRRRHPKWARALRGMRRLRQWPIRQERVANHLAPVACNANRLVHAGGSWPKTVRIQNHRKTRLPKRAWTNERKAPGQSALSRRARGTRSPLEPVPELPNDAVAGTENSRVGSFAWHPAMASGIEAEKSASVHPFTIGRQYPQPRRRCQGVGAPRLDGPAWFLQSPRFSQEKGPGFRPAIGPAISTQQARSGRPIQPAEERLRASPRTDRP